MSRPLRSILLGVALSSLLGAGLASANAGVPMLTLMWPAAWIVFVPITAIEAALAHRLLGVTPRRSLFLSGAANAFSTLVGLPLTWLILVALEALLTSGGTAYGLDTPTRALLALTVQAPWLIPYEGALYWLVPAAALFLCIPFYFMSVFTERFVVLRLAHDANRRSVQRWSWLANTVTYGLIVAALGIYLAIALLTHHAAP